MKELEECLEALLAEVKPIEKTEYVALTDACDRILGEDIFQDILGLLDICIVRDPHFDLQPSLIPCCYVGDGHIGKSTVRDHDVLVING